MTPFLPRQAPAALALALGLLVACSSGSTPHPAPSDTTPPSVPTGLTALGVSPAQVNLAWAASTDDVGVAGYRVFREGVLVATTTATVHEDTGLAASTAYAYAVLAFDAAGNASAPSAAAQATTLAHPDVTPPSVPTGLTALGVSPAQVNLAWAASTDDVGIAGYRVFRDGALVATTTATSQADTGLAASTAYAYAVLAFDAAGNASAPSAAAQATTLAHPDVTPPSVPSGLTATPVSAARIDLAWSASTDDVGVAGYRVFRGGTQVGTTTSTAYPDAGLTASTAYAYTVVAFDGAGNASVPSVQAQATTPAAPDVTAPSVPTGLTATAVSQTEIDLAWSASTDAVGVTGYEVRRDGTKIATVATTAYADAGLSPGTLHAYTVSARDAAGNVSAPSAGAQATTPAAPDVTAPSVPTGLTATAVSQTEIDLAWSASTDAVGVTGYEVRRDGTKIATVATTAYADAGLSPGTLHAYTVSARDAAGNVSAPSAPASATTGGGGGGPGTPRLVQHLASSTNAPGKTESGNHFKFTLPNPVLAGNCLVLGVAFGASGSLAATPVTDTNGTWSATPAATATDANGQVDLAIFVLPNATAGVHTITVHFTGNVIPFQYTVSEFSGIATSNPVSGSGSSSNVLAPNLTAGTFTPANNDANGGNLVWALFWDDANPGSGHEVTTFTAGSGFTLLDANIGWHVDASCHHASEWTVQATAAQITPSLNAAMSPSHDPFIGLSIALRAANAGTPPGAGMRIVRILHFTNETFGVGNFRLQAPSSGNLLVLVTHEDFIVKIAGLTDSKGNGWTKVIDGQDRPQFWVAPGPTTGGDLALTLAITGTPQPASFTVYDIAGAAAAPVGAASWTQGFIVISGASSVSDFPALTPTSPDGLAIAACGLGQGPALGFASGAPAGAIFDFVNYAGQTDGSTMNNSDCRGHVWTTSTATLHWNWLLTPIGNNSGSASALHLLAP